jgi:cytochrome c oxidase assembly factor CtaG
VDPYSWSWDPDALVVVPALGVAYVIALRRFPAARWRVAAFFGGLVLLLAVLITPVDTIALHYLLTAHLLQNVVLAEWAPLLCVVGLPPALAAALGRLPLAAVATHPLVALPVWLATYFAWHVPALYDAALRNLFLLHLEHACYFAAGTLLWWPVVHDAPRRLRPAGTALYVFAAFLLASPLGLLLALLPEPAYSFYEAAPRLWGLSPLEDQQIAGLTMAAEEAVVFFAVFSFFFARFLRQDEPDEAPERPSAHEAEAREGPQPRLVEPR